jgi:hypothetical protein
MANPHIRIEHFTGGLRGEDLKELHFQETSSDNSKFHLFKGEEQIHTNPEALSSREGFSFVFNAWCWAITDFWISEKELKATGDWLSKSCDDNDDPETGTFQAQGGPGREAELKASASGAVK